MCLLQMALTFLAKLLSRPVALMRHVLSLSCRKLSLPLSLSLPHKTLSLLFLEKSHQKVCYRLLGKQQQQRLSYRGGAAAAEGILLSSLLILTVALSL